MWGEEEERAEPRYLELESVSSGLVGWEGHKKIPLGFLFICKVWYCSEKRAELGYPELESVWPGWVGGRECGRVTRITQYLIIQPSHFHSDKNTISSPFKIKSFHVWVAG